jgi:hypothetical protein
MHETMIPVRIHPVERLRPQWRTLAAAVWRLMRRHPIALIGGALLTIDVAFIAIQIAVDATDYGFNGAYRLALETEAGVAQFYGWVKAGAAAFLLFGAWRRFHSPTAGLWAGALAYLGIDDALRLHENLGSFFANAFSIGEVGPLRGQDIGELIAYGLILVIAVTALVVAEWRDRGATPSVLTQLMIPAVGLFLFFAVIVDTVGGVLPEVVQIAVEDGGELLVLTGVLVISLIWSHQAIDLAEASTS